MSKALVVDKHTYEQNTIFYVNQLAMARKEEFFRHDGYDMFSKEEISDPLMIMRPMLVERDRCEHDETLLQVIPYITLFDTNTDKVFIYQRGAHTGERRLTGNCSIGIGGHVEVMPGNSDAFPRVLAEEAARELFEEVGIPMTTELIIDLESRFRNGKYLAIYSDENEVSRVHLGLGLIVHSSPMNITEREQDIISSPNWMHPIDIIVQHERGIITLEPWSLIMIHEIQQSFVEVSLPKHRFTLQEARQQLYLP